MKQFSILFAILLLLISCEPSKREKLIIGKWSYSATYSSNLQGDRIPNGTMTYLLENIDEYCADYTEKEFGSFQIFFNLYVEETDAPYTIIIEYDSDYQGIWSIDGDELVQRGDYCTYKFSKGYALDPNTHYDEQYYVKLMHAYADTAIVNPLIDVMIDEHRAEIFESSRDELTLKYKDNAVMQTLTKIKKPQRNE